MKMLKIETKSYFKSYKSYLIKPEDYEAFKKDMSYQMTKILWKEEVEIEDENLTVIRGDERESELTNTEQMILTSGGRGSSTR